MKFSRKLFLILCIGLIVTPGKTQGLNSIAEGDVLISPSITLGWYNYGYGLDVVNVLPPVALNFEYAATDLVSFGLEAEYGLRRYQDFNFVLGSNKYKYEYKGLSLRGSFHYLDLLKNIFGDDLGSLNAENLDFYIGASTGYLITNYTASWQNSPNGARHESKSFSSSWRFGYMAGFRYFFNNNFGAFLETGKNSLGWAKLGITLKI